MEYPALVGGFKETRDSHRAPLSSAQAGEINTQHSFGVFLKSPLSHLEKCFENPDSSYRRSVFGAGHRTHLGAWPAVFLCWRKKMGSLCSSKPLTSYSLSCPPWPPSQERSRAGQVQLLSPRVWGWGAMQVLRPMSELLITEVLRIPDQSITSFCNNNKITPEHTNANLRE